MTTSRIKSSLRLLASRAEAEQFAWDLIQRLSVGQDELAFVFRGADEVLYARHSPSSTHEPRNAVLNLVQGLYRAEPFEAKRTVRSRIYTTAQKTDLAAGVIRVVAKRCSYSVRPVDHGKPTRSRWIDVTGGFECVTLPPLPTKIVTGASRFAAPLDDAYFMGLAHRIARSLNEERPIAALLVSSAGEILSWAVNTGRINRTLHAEVILIHSYYARTGRGLPEGAKIYTTLQCCKMCAAMIVTASENPASIRVYYGEADPGPTTRETALNRKSARSGALEQELKPEMSFSVNLISESERSETRTNGV
jgi:tRNA(Arg) A34 adenosine deaminase TadA